MRCMMLKKRMRAQSDHVYPVKRCWWRCAAATPPERYKQFLYFALLNVGKSICEPT